MVKIQMVETGDIAPAFQLPSTGNKHGLDQKPDKNTILVFYPADGTDVCSNQLALYNEVLPIFEEYDAEVLGISVDRIKDHDKFAKELNLRFPLLSDSDPKGDVSRLFGVFDEKNKTSQRALFVIDKSGTVRWKYISPYHINPGAEGILKALENI